MFLTEHQKISSGLENWFQSATSLRLEGGRPRQRAEAPPVRRLAVPDLIPGAVIELCFCRRWQLNEEECYPGTKHSNKLNEYFPVRMSSLCVFLLPDALNKQNN